MTGPLAGVLALLAAYLISGIPFGYLLIKMRSGDDIRRSGSGNIGATNVFRTGGKGAGILTLVLDIGKGALSVWIVRLLTGEPAWEAAGALVAVAGHCYPVYLRFRGGKGIATGCGAYAVLAPLPMGLTLAVFLLTATVSRVVSLGSIAAGLALPFFVIWLRPEAPLLLSVAGAALLVIARHHENIRRLLRGGEHRIEGTRDER